MLSVISDHASVLVRVDVPMPQVNVLDRMVWDFAHADWISLLWNVVLSYDNFDTAVERLCETILEKVRRYVPRKTISECKGSHPWLDDQCLDAVRHKHHCQGTEHFEAAARACTDVISSAHRKFIKKQKAELKSPKRGSKQWWSIAKTLLDGATNISGIPSVQKHRWALDT